MTDLHDLVAPYVLDALDPGERSDFERHLSTCLSCQRELSELQPGVTVLAEAVSVTPPPSLKNSVMAAVGDDVVTPMTERSGPSNRLAWSLVAVAAVVALVFIGLWAVTAGQLGEAQEVATVFAAPDATVVDLEGSHGPARFVYSASLERGVFNGGRLIDIDESEVYELWLIDSGGADRAGTLRPGETDVIVEGVRPGLTLAMTVEPAPGVDQPTSDPVLVGDI